MVKYLRKIRMRSYVMLGILTVIYCSNVMFITFQHSTTLSGIQNNNREKFAGSESCAGCHKTIYESHIKTAHYLDSRPASKEFIKGQFTAGKNHFVYNKWMEVVMEQKKNEFFQTAFINGSEFQRERFDMVIGSGRKGQTYLYWNDNKLFQLPVSYYTPLNNWCNSPGFSTNFIKFDRLIPAQCLECHGTFAKSENDAAGVPFFDKSQIIYGIDCERCHGPAADHVAYFKEHPEDKTSKFIINSKLLNRQQRLDACALCHSGFRDAIQPAFSFQAGDKLDDFSRAKYSTDSVSTLDVHGNQYGLLTASKCFKVSSQMDCSSCHNVHQNEVNSPELFSQRCTVCHTQTKHSSATLAAATGMQLSNNCIDCHMPMLPSQKIVLNVSGTENTVPDLVRTHRVGIYPEITSRFLKKVKAVQ